MALQMGGQRALPPGTLVHGRYRILRTLGEGGFGVTYQVTDLHDGSIAAMKEYMPLEIAGRRFLSNDVVPRPEHRKEFERFRERFLKEAKIIHSYRDDPNIIGVRHLFYDNNTAYYVMDFLEGQDLSRHLQSLHRPMTWQELRPILEQIVAALRLVHGSGVIHCDISPDNIFLENGGRVRLIDFGAAKGVMQEQSSIVLLKRGYAPPEQLSSRGKLGPWTDIYALAVTIYHCMTGLIPPGAEDRLTGAPVQWPSRMGIELPGCHWEQALQKAMAVRPGDRYQNVDAFWRDLCGAAAVACCSGIYRGRIFPVTGELLLGTDPGRCSLIYPRGTPGVSRVHLRFFPGDSGVRAMDMGSTYGTFLQGRKMTPGLVYELRPGEMLSFGQREQFILSESTCTEEEKTLVQ